MIISLLLFLFINNEDGDDAFIAVTNNGDYTNDIINNDNIVIIGISDNGNSTNAFIAIIKNETPGFFFPLMPISIWLSS